MSLTIKTLSLVMCCLLASFGYADEGLIDSSDANFTDMMIAQKEVGIIKLSKGRVTVLRFPEAVSSVYTDGGMSTIQINQSADKKDLVLKPKMEDPGNLYVYTQSNRYLMFKFEFVEMGEHHRTVDVLPLVQNNKSYASIPVSQLLFVTRNWDRITHPSHMAIKRRLKRFEPNRVLKSKRLKATIKEAYVCRLPRYFMCVLEITNTTPLAMRIKKENINYVYLKDLETGKLYKPATKQLKKQLIPYNGTATLVMMFRYSELNQDTLFDIHLMTDAGEEVLTLKRKGLRHVE
ncbi:MAG: hypothetical protein GY816_00590 [Cytophagales bacterium]|nr:hypothetical protein [Cytophagales bacterium]